jgi:hypothetical protein
MPENWMPWNYTETLAALQSPAGDRACAPAGASGLPLGEFESQRVFVPIILAGNLRRAGRWLVFLMLPGIAQ